MKNPLHTLSQEELWQLFPIQLKPYNPSYPQWYEEEKSRLKELLGDHIVRINHVGSTAVKDLLSKPIIDILLEVSDTTSLDDILPTLLDNGYINMNPGDNEFPKLIIKGYTISGFSDRVFHLHMRRLGDYNELYFRDYLNDHPEAVRGYAKVKETLFKDFEHHRENYTNGKTEFIEAQTTLARKQYNNRYKP